MTGPVVRTRGLVVVAVVALVATGCVQDDGDTTAAPSPSASAAAVDPDTVVLVDVALVDLLRLDDDALVAALVGHPREELVTALESWSAEVPGPFGELRARLDRGLATELQVVEEGAMGLLREAALEVEAAAMADGGTYRSTADAQALIDEAERLAQPDRTVVVVRSDAEGTCIEVRDTRYPRLVASYDTGTAEPAFAVPC